MRVLVVGAGIIGLSAAEALVTTGHSVMVYEQGQIPPGAAGGHSPLIGETLAEVIAGRRTAGDFFSWISGHWISGGRGAMEDAAPPV